MSPELAIVAEIRQRCPGQPLTYGIDHKGCYAHIGEFSARAGPAPVDALRAALPKAAGGAS